MSEFFAKDGKEKADLHLLDLNPYYHGVWERYHLLPASLVTLGS